MAVSQQGFGEARRRFLWPALRKSWAVRIFSCGPGTIYACIEHLGTQNGISARDFGFGHWHIPATKPLGVLLETKYKPLTSLTVLTSRYKLLCNSPQH